MRRLVTAFRLAFYPAHESREAKRLAGLTMEAENARHSGELAKAETLYLTAIAEAHSASAASYLHRAQHGLATVYQEQHKYPEAERIFQNQLEAAARSPAPNTLLHGSHMSLARLYQDQGRFTEAETQYKAALAETEKEEVFPGRGFWCSTATHLARFYVERRRYSAAEALFQKMRETYERERSASSYLPHHLQEFAKLCATQGKYQAAGELYRRALEVSEQLHGTNSLLTVRALDDLAGFCQANRRYLEAENLYRRSLACLEEHISSEVARPTRRWRRWRSSKERAARISRSEIPISTALERLASVCEDQQKYAEAEPLRRRSLAIKERAWGERYTAFLGDSLLAHANVLHKIGREQEAAEIGKRAQAIRLKYPPGSMQCSVRSTVRPIKRNLRWRFSVFVRAILDPSSARPSSR